MNVFQVTATAVDGTAAHDAEIAAMKVAEGGASARVDGPPHERVHADAPPNSAHVLSTHHHVHGSHLVEYFCGHVSRKLKPVWWCCCCALLMNVDFLLLRWPRRTNWLRG